MKTALSQRSLVVASIYTLLALLWITFSDQLLALFIRDPGQLTYFQTIKGWFFVGVTALILYYTLRKAERTAAEASAPELSTAFRSSLRRRVVRLVILTTVPLIVLTIYNSAQQRQRDRANAKEQVMRFAHLVAARQERIINSIHETLFTLAKLPAVHQADARACNGLFADLLSFSLRHAAIGAALPDGTVFACAPAGAVTNNLSRRPWFRQTLEREDFSVADFTSADPNYELVCAQPVYDAGDNLHAVVFATVDSQWLSRFATELRLPADAVVTLVNHHGIITGRSIDAPIYVGRKVPFGHELTGRTSGLFNSRDIDGVNRIQAFLPAIQATVIVGFPATLVTLEANRALFRNLLIIALVALIAIGVAAGMAELSIFRHLRELT
ncbi:MAG: cache domain-containing protein, partial [Verrucomicrobiota bacterium]